MLSDGTLRLASSSSNNVFDTKIEVNRFDIKPKNNATVASPLHMKFGSEGIEIAPVPPGDVTKTRSGVAHYHVGIDQPCLPAGKTIVKGTPSWVHFGDGKSEFDTQLTPGTHKLALQLGDDLRESLAHEIRLDPLLKRREIQLFEPEDLLRRERLEPELGQRLAAPERQSLSQPLATLFPFERPRGRGEPLEPLQVDRVRINREPVARRARHEDIRAEQLAQRRDGVLKRRPRRAGRVLAPQPVDQHVRRDDVVRAQEERDEQCALLLPAEWERLTVGGEYLEGTEDPKVEHTHVVARLLRDYERPAVRRLHDVSAS